MACFTVDLNVWKFSFGCFPELLGGESLAISSSKPCHFPSICVYSEELFVVSMHPWVLVGVFPELL
eukprot:snap_masked-scaffold_19-processed-gene-2.3-mRNA-1 protein AED:1.00 eAED:1.00 QI:0/0/0/0/1/1/2/0/65